MKRTIFILVTFFVLFETFAMPQSVPQQPRMSSLSISQFDFSKGGCIFSCEFRRDPSLNPFDGPGSTGAVDVSPEIPLPTAEIRFRDYIARNEANTSYSLMTYLGQVQKFSQAIDTFKAKVEAKDRRAAPTIGLQQLSFVRNGLEQTEPQNEDYQEAILRLKLINAKRITTKMITPQNPVNQRQNLVASLELGNFDFTKDPAHQNLTLKDCATKLFLGEFGDSVRKAARKDRTQALKLIEHYCGLRNGTVGSLPKNRHGINQLKTPRNPWNRPISTDLKLSKQIMAREDLTKDGMHRVATVANNSIEDNILNNPDNPFRIGFEDSNDCARCHPEHYKEWKGSTMAYAGLDPIFHGMELKLRQIFQQRFNDTGNRAGQTQVFCQRCHAPPAFLSSKDPGPVPGVTDRTFSPLDHDPGMVFYSNKELQGVSCHYCHSVSHTHMNARNGDGSLVSGTGVSSRNHNVFPSYKFLGPFNDLELDGLIDQHKGSSTAQGSDYLKSSQFCGSCHDVHPNRADRKTGENFLRVENLYTEFLQYRQEIKKRTNTTVQCQDCHMSLYPLTPKGVYPQTTITTDNDFGTPKKRKHTLHHFTAVTVPLIDDPERIANINTHEVNEFGYPYGNQQRRELMLKNAASLYLPVDNAGAFPEDGDDLENTITMGSQFVGSEQVPILKVRIAVENTGTGHGIPAGFSQEREVWVHLKVFDTRRGGKRLVYESGMTNPDDDHNLAAEVVRLNPDTLQADEIIFGQDYNLRPQFNLGLVNFRNHLEHMTGFPEGDLKKDQKTVDPRLAELVMQQGVSTELSEEEVKDLLADKESKGGDADGKPGKIKEVFSVHLANVINNTISLKPFQPRLAKWDVRLDDIEMDKILVEARLLYRALPPHFIDPLVKSEERRVSSTKSKRAPKPILDRKALLRNQIIEMTKVSYMIRKDKPVRLLTPEEQIPANYERVYRNVLRFVEDI